MPLLIDTYNVLHVTGVLPPHLAGIDAHGLIRLLARSRYARQRITLVCDGVPPPHAAATEAQLPVNTQLIYTGPGREADDEIDRLIRASSAPRRLTVVSSDRRVQQAAKRRKCRVFSSELLLKHLAEDASRPSRPSRALQRTRKPEVPLDDAQVLAWKALFGVDDASSPPASAPRPPQNPSNQSPPSPPHDHSKSPQNQPNSPPIPPSSPLNPHDNAPPSSPPPAPPPPDHPLDPDNLDWLDMRDFFR